MDQEENFEWIDFYSELADKIAPYRSRRPELIKIVEAAYAQMGMRLPKLDNGEPTDIDPFTVFGLFNKGIKDENRTKIAARLAEALGMSSKAPTEFPGIPVLNNLSATFYRFEGERGSNDIDNLWETFDAALAYADSEEDAERSRLASAYDAAAAQTGIKWNLTMGLFWIRPYSYISLDGRNRWAMADERMLGDRCAAAVAALKDLPDAETYLEVRDLCRASIEEPGSEYDGFPAFSYAAWKESERVNEEIRRAKKSELVDGESTMGDEGARETHYWIYSPGAEAAKWEEFMREGIAALEWNKIGDLREFEDKEDIRRAIAERYGGEGSHKNDSLALYQFANEMMPGDVIFAKRGMNKIIGRGVVKSGYRFDEARGDSYRHVRDVEWTDRGEWEYPEGRAPMKTLTDLTRYTDLVGKLKALFEDSDGDDPEPEWPSYTRDDFLDEVYMDADAYDRLVSLLEHKRNVILQGAPGVGKTFMAKRLAYSMMGAKDRSRVELVQFHQSYSYEDFVMGYRPSENGFTLRRGTFYEFCRRAEEDSDNDYFFIIDEINRGNLSKIFGELFMLVEPDKRGVEMRLLYSDERFAVPENLYLIGTMNTADRSLAMMDYALRRRFAFYELDPGFETEGFKEYQRSLASPALDALVSCIEGLNAEIEADDTLGRGFRIGHSFLCNLKEATPERLREVVDYEIAPLLEEYWFDDLPRAREWAARLRASING